MANVREYAYFIKGNKIAIVEKDTSLDNDTGSRDFGPGSNRSQWKSPLATVTDGIEIEYTYAPTYKVNDADDTLAISAYTESSGLLSLTIPSSSFTVDDYILITGSDKINGLHQVNATTSGSTTLVLKTKYNGGAVTEGSTLYQDINVLSDEDDELDITRYQANAVVDYLKAKVFEDAGNIDMKEYFMKQFYKKLEKNESAKKRGIRAIVSGIHGIR